MKYTTLKRSILGCLLVFGTVNSASAITLQPGDSYRLGGSLTFPGNFFSLDEESFLTVNSNNTVSIVMKGDLINGWNGFNRDAEQSPPKTAKLNIDSLVLAGTGTNAFLGTTVEKLMAPAGAATNAFSIRPDEIYSTIGQIYFDESTTKAFDLGISMPAAIDTARNSLVIWGAFFPDINNNMDVYDIHFTIGEKIPQTEVPEPMTLTLLGIGVFGGVVRNRKIRAA